MLSLKSYLGRVAFLLTIALPLGARALPFDWNVRVEPGVAFPLTDPQASRFGVGGGAAIKGGIAPHKWVEAHLALHMLGFSAKEGDGSGLLGIGAGGRFRYLTKLFVAPWVDLDLMYARTGSLNRFALAAAVGADFPIPFPKDRQLWAGPFIRYMHVFSGDAPPTGTADAKVLIIGATVSFGTPHPLTHAAGDSDGDGILDDADRCPHEAEDKDSFEDADGCPELDNDKDGVFDEADKCPNVAGPKATAGCPDGDKDGIVDTEDKCPDKAGPVENGGCPREYDGVKIGEGKLELRDKIYFAYDKAEILPKSFDILNQVVSVLKDNADLKVRIEGHTDSQGSANRNLKLSQDRADAVRDYLVANGISPDRLESKGYGANQPLESNKTAEGRERNRRVEFVIIK